MSKNWLDNRGGSILGAYVALAGFLAILTGVVPASAGIFDFLFGGSPGGQQQRRGAPPPPSQPIFPFPFFGGPPTVVDPSLEGAGPYVAYCVRLCDGRYFPMQRSVVSQSAQICQSLCPAAKTKVFSGSDIKYATAIDGMTYEHLENAFVYREKIVPGCTCNGREPFGLAVMKIEDDPTLVPGDLVSTKDGFVRYTGYGRNQFTPIEIPARPGKRRLSSQEAIMTGVPE